MDEADLLARGSAAARVGENEEARAYLEALTARNPASVEGWLALAAVVPEPRKKRDLFQKVLALQPDHAEAKAGLQRLAEKYGASILEDETGAEVFTCTWHPDRETLLRCSRCGRPMCTSCAVRHPVGMRCKECVKELRSPIYVVSGPQLATAFVVSLGLSIVAGWVFFYLSRTGFAWIIAFFVGAAVGAGIADIAGRAAGRKRGKTLAAVVAACMIGGAVIASFLPPFFGLATLLTGIGTWIYLFVGVSAAIARLR
jgi:hypothetical protein